MLEFKWLFGLIGLYLVSLSVHGQECVDYDGDGWGWDGTKSCVIHDATTDNTQFNEPDTLTSNICVDSDRDGWGWDGMKSCRIEDQPDCDSLYGDGWIWNGSQCEATNSAETRSECLDPDGDGWGWDGLKSCRIPPAVPSDRHECVDQDGDGYGWNGINTCYVKPDVSMQRNFISNRPWNDAVYECKHKFIGTDSSWFWVLSEAGSLGGIVVNRTEIEKLGSWTFFGGVLTITNQHNEISGWEIFEDHLSNDWGRCDLLAGETPDFEVESIDLQREFVISKNWAELPVYECDNSLSGGDSSWFYIFREDAILGGVDNEGREQNDVGRWERSGSILEVTNHIGETTRWEIEDDSLSVPWGQCSGISGTVPLPSAHATSSAVDGSFISIDDVTFPDANTPTVTISGSIMAPALDPYLLFVVENMESNEYLSIDVNNSVETAYRFVDQIHENTSKLSSFDGVNGTWEVTLPIGDSGGYNFSIKAFSKDNYELVPTAETKFFLEEHAIEDPITYEESDLYLPAPSVAKTVGIESRAHPIEFNGIGASVKQKLVANTGASIWPRNSVIKVAAALGNNRDRANNYSFYKDIEPLCQSQLQANATGSSLPVALGECENALLRHIVNTANIWSTHGAISFEASDWMSAHVRIEFVGRGNNSALGWFEHQKLRRDTFTILSKNTMNLGEISTRTILHEFGHVLGFSHEHSNPRAPWIYNTPFAAEQYAAINGWDLQKALDQIEQVNTRSVPYMLVVDDVYDRESIMHYPIPLLASRSSDPNQYMINDITLCDSNARSTGICIGASHRLSVGDIRGMQALYPRDDLLLTDLRTKNAEWAVYSSALDGTAHAILFNQLTVDQRKNIIENFRDDNKLEYSVIRVPSADLVIDECTGSGGSFFGSFGDWVNEAVGACNKILTGEAYQALMHYEGSLLSKRTFTVKGRENVSTRLLESSFQSNGATYFCSSVSCLSRALTGTSSPNRPIKIFRPVGK